MIRFAVFAALLPIAACEGDESLSGYADRGTIYALIELNGAAFDARATLVLQRDGEIGGQAPCNTWHARQTAPYPWFELGPIAATRMACVDLAAETAFFDALAQMTISEVSGDVLILSNTDGGRMVFQAE